MSKDKNPNARKLQELVEGGMAAEAAIQKLTEAEVSPEIDKIIKQEARMAISQFTSKPLDAFTQFHKSETGAKFIEWVMSTYKVSEPVARVMNELVGDAWTDATAAVGTGLQDLLARGASMVLFKPGDIDADGRLKGSKFKKL